MQTQNPIYGGGPAVTVYVLAEPRGIRKRKRRPVTRRLRRQAFSSSSSGNPIAYGLTANFYADERPRFLPPARSAVLAAPTLCRAPPPGTRRGLHCRSTRDRLNSAST